MRSPDAVARGWGRAYANRRGVIVTALVLTTAALLSGAVWAATWLAREPAPRVRIDDVATQYVTLALALDRVRPGEVDAYFGPATYVRAAAAGERRPERLLAAAQDLRHVLDRSVVGGGDRRRRLEADLDLLVERLQAHVSGHRASLIQEATAMYGGLPVPPLGTEVRAARAALEAALPGSGALHDRMRAHRARLAIPDDRRTDVFTRAMAACRAVTTPHWPLPRDESVTLEWRTIDSAAWHRYLGGRRSRVTVNRAGIALLDVAVDVACHETYPGHHAQFLLIDDAGRGGMPVEDRLAMLRSSATALREGAAQFAVEMALPPPARLALERDVLAPLAGIAAVDVERQHAVRPHLRVLERMVPVVFAAWDNGQIDDAEAARRLEEDALVGDGHALVRFARQQGAYVLAYTVARDRVAAAVAAEQARSGADVWTALRTLVTSPAGGSLLGAGPGR